jgi:hypothetical protein
LLKEFYGGFVTLFLSGQSTTYLQKITLLMLTDIIMFNPMNGIELATEVTIFFHGLTFEHMSGQFIFRVDKVGSIKDTNEFLTVFAHSD